MTEIDNSKKQKNDFITLAKDIFSVFVMPIPLFLFLAVIVMIVAIFVGIQ